MLPKLKKIPVKSRVLGKIGCTLESLLTGEHYETESAFISSFVLKNFQWFCLYMFYICKKVNVAVGIAAGAVFLLWCLGALYQEIKNRKADKIYHQDKPVTEQEKEHSTEKE